jgi:methionyl aminopeptidase
MARGGFLLHTGGTPVPPGAGVATMARMAKTLKERDVQGAVDAAAKVVEMHQRLAEFLAMGQTLAQIDGFVARTLEEMSCKSCFRGYRVPKLPPFPSYACLSVNECVVHGTAGYYREPMKAGDLLKIDIGVSYKGWIGDAAWTYAMGEPTDEMRRLTDAGKRSLSLGCAELKPGNTYIEWARVVQHHVEEVCGFHLIRGLGGHGYGRKLHEPPFVSNVVPSYPGEWSDAGTACVPGTLIAVEPMIAVGTGKTVQERGLWPIYSADGSMSVHYEHDVLIAEDGPRVLTAGLEQIDDVIERCV